MNATKVLKKYPENEMEYFLAIEGLGGNLFWINHDIADGRYKSNKSLEDWMEEARNIQAHLVDELFEKFGVVKPKDCPKDRRVKPSFGMIWYWDWYKKMKYGLRKEEYNHLICSACPFSQGADAYVHSESIPCSEWKGVLYSLHVPFECGMIGHGYDTEEELLSKMTDEQRRAFLIKKEVIKRNYLGGKYE